MVLKIQNLKELQKLAKALAKTLKGGEILALSGELGAGKTTFTKLLFKELGIKSRIVSPTFILMVPYIHNGKTYYHLDLYRTNSPKEVQGLGIEELWGKKNNIFVIEWAERIKKYLPKKTVFLKLEVVSVKTGERKITIKNVKKNFKI
ncbi:MAG: tRNA (adenosine(37)-N6)-threonylcarbamoyltransferase complex ATPase subunit type 1 TsaE [Candidatus Doudnabacteria bacterium]